MSTPLSDSEWRDLLLSVGTHKKNRRRKPLEVSSLLERAIDQHSMQFVSEKISLDESMIDRFLRLFDLPDELQPLIIWGRYPGYLSFSVAIEMSNVGDPSISRKLAKTVLENGLTKMEVRATIQSMKRKGIDLDKAIESVLNLRPITEKLMMFMGVLPAELTEQIDQDDARNKLRRFLASKVGARNVVSVSFKNGKYSFMLNVDDQQSSAFAGTINQSNLKRFVVNALES